VIWATGMWYLQDLLQVAASSGVPVPELFFLFLLLLSVTEEYDLCGMVWIAFVGGLFWDLRWTGLPGFTAGLYGLLLSLVAGTWRLIPVQGRTSSLFGCCALGAHLVIGLMRGALLLPTGASLWPLVLLQQLAGMPLILLGILWFSRREGPCRVP